MADDLVLKIRTDATDAAKGLKPLTDGLNKAEREAAEAAKSLSKLDSMKVTPTVDVDDTPARQAIKRAREEIARLRDQIAQDVELGADTRPAQRRIAELQSAIKKLDDQPVKLKVDTAGLDQAKRDVSGFGSSLNGLGVAGAGVLARFGPAGVVGALGAAGYAATKMAADMESASLQMKFVIRDGGDVAAMLEEIKAFASTSPFEFAELQQSAKTLASFGVASSDVVDTLRNLGEVAAATGAPVSDLTLIYGQMLAKGKIQSEELLQFAERGVPIFEALGNVLGVSADEARELAASGQLGRKEIERLDDALGDMFGGATAAQAETFNGQLSTMKDNLKAIGVQVGESLLDDEKGLAGGLNKFLEKMPTAIDKTAEFVELLRRLDPTQWGELGKEDPPIITKLPQATAKIEENTDATDEAADAAKHLADNVEDANRQFQGMIDALNILNSDFVSAREATSNYQASVDDVAESIKEHGRTLDLNTEAGRNNDAAVREQAASIAALADARLRDMQTSGETTTEITGDYEKQRQSLVDTMVQMGLTKTQAEAYATQLLKTPKELKTTASLIIPPEFITKLNYISGEKTLTITPKMNEADALRIERRIGAIIFGPTPGSPSGNSAPPVPPGRVAAPAVTLTNRVRVYVDGASVAGAIRADVSTAAGSAAREAVTPRRL